MRTTLIKKALRFVLPSVCSQCAIFLFTIIDGIFVGRGVGTDALGAVNLALPYMMVLSAIYMLTVIGGVTITAIRIGSGDVDGANQAFMHALTINLLFSVLFLVFGTCFNDVLVTALGAKGIYHDMVSDYIFWCSAFTIPSSLAMLMQGFGRNDNAPVLVMIATIVSTACNVFLDWLFVFPLQMGLAGAAIATGISQVISFGIIAMHFVLKRGVLRVSGFRFEGALVKKVLLRGSPEMLSQLTTPIMTLCMNAIVMKYLGNNGINAYSVISYVTSLAFAVILGVAEGMQPLFGQSFGERNAPDLKFYYRAGWEFALIGSLIIYALAIVTGRDICELFGADAAATGMAVLALPKYGWLFMFAALNTLIAAYLYSTRRTKESMVVNALRGFVFIPACVMGITTVSSGALVCGWCC